MAAWCALKRNQVGCVRLAYNAHFLEWKYVFGMPNIQCRFEERIWLHNKNSLKPNFCIKTQRGRIGALSEVNSLANKWSPFELYQVIFEIGPWHIFFASTDLVTSQFRVSWVLSCGRFKPKDQKRRPGACWVAYKSARAARAAPAAEHQSPVKYHSEGLVYTFRIGAKGE